MHNWSRAKIALAACKTLQARSNGTRAIEHRPVRYGPKTSMGHLLGAEKIIFLITILTAAMMLFRESCQSWLKGHGLLGRYRRVQSPTPPTPLLEATPHGPLRYSSIGHDLPKISIHKPLESRTAMRSRRLPDIRRSHKASASIYPPKSVIWTRWRPAP